jgi:hypothetical protein
MSEAAVWLTARITDAPDALRDRMLAALSEVSGAEEIHEHLGQASALCLERAMAEQARRESAMDLLAADALLTHACEAAAEAGSDVLAAFAGAWDATRFERLLPTAKT